LRRFGYELAPLLIAMILGPIMEANFRTSLIISDGNFSIFITRPVSATLIIATAILFITSGLTAHKKAKKRISEETIMDED